MATFQTRASERRTRRSARPPTGTRRAAQDFGVCGKVGEIDDKSKSNEPTPEARVPGEGVATGGRCLCDRLLL